MPAVKFFTKPRVKTGADQVTRAPGSFLWLVMLDLSGVLRGQRVLCPRDARRRGGSEQAVGVITARRHHGPSGAARGRTGSAGGSCRGDREDPSTAGRVAAD